MNFNSIFFLVFLIIVFSIHWILFSKTSKLQNIFLLLSSFCFYAGWDYRFLSLILFSIVVDFFVGISIEKSLISRHKKLLLTISLVSNLGLLFVFKYFNFFIDSFYNLLNEIGLQINLRTINIILPVGISFYTFQTLSYTIDVYKGKIKATKDWVLFASYVSFFPQLVAGPIERATRILPQLSSRRVFDWINAKEGLRKILIGFFKKIVIADSLAPMVDFTFNNYHDLSSLSLLLGALFFSIQIYCDFSGYSDIAIGVSKLFGINLIENFNYPYFSKNIGEFWKRWHISLTSWFRDYIYIPLGGSKVSVLISLRNVFIIFIISGLWHGANWTFVFWGIAHVLIYVPYFLMKKKIFYNNSTFSYFLKDIFGIITTFSVVTITWIFFRSDTIIDAWNYIFRLFSITSDQNLILNPANNLNSGYYIIYILFMFLVDYYLSLEIKENIWVERVFNSLLILLILFFMQINISESFIYFQF